MGFLAGVSTISGKRRQLFKAGYVGICVQYWLSITVLESVFVTSFFQIIAAASRIYFFAYFISSLNFCGFCGFVVVRYSCRLDELSPFVWFLWFCGCEIYTRISLALDIFVVFVVLWLWHILADLISSLNFCGFCGFVVVRYLCWFD